ncbi:hypothetical protein [Streptomyces sp. NPDC088135]|uniref:hypothetical protein n=1 Tax=Streptomyces sp. NPDC088135 TaxID=3160993 RepID=UPI0034288C48
MSYEWKLDAVRAEAGGVRPDGRWWRRGLPPAPVPGEPAVRAELAGCYRWMARQCKDTADHEKLIDLSHAVRPQTRYWFPPRRCTPGGS